MNQSHAAAQQTVDRAQAVYHTFSGIMTSVSSIEDMNMQIATAAEKQQSSVEDIDRNFDEVGESAMQFEQISHTTRDGSQKLEASAQEMSELVAKLIR